MANINKQKDFKTWYAHWSKKLNLDPDPNHWRHFYDYKAAHKANAEPKYNKEDKKFHWDSKFKSDFHPNRFVFDKGKWLDSKYNKNVSFSNVLAWEEKRQNMLLSIVNR
tara:strand:+ start:178 stop:504 length:327 start_codon:yes stop_codon:yes gene_type:complete